MKRDNHSKEACHEAVLCTRHVPHQTLQKLCADSRQGVGPSFARHVMTIDTPFTVSYTRASLSISNSLAFCGPIDLNNRDSLTVSPSKSRQLRACNGRSCLGSPQSESDSSSVSGARSPAAAPPLLQHLLQLQTQSPHAIAQFQQMMATLAALGGGLVPPPALSQAWFMQRLLHAQQPATAAAPHHRYVRSARQ
ncbi:hypothetical protein EVAR_101955_1 [Eumeta japonica]|uniref:Uncharacterized protein n=1 Tax=Eumeta variegata TaxID=151549 RepID=A0A4C1TSF2_EUMVA|nr:hypothetical protein EVAR_101955_1 [Eumeta japonica]